MVSLLHILTRQIFSGSTHPMSIALAPPDWRKSILVSYSVKSMNWSMAHTMLWIASVISSLLT